MSNKLPRRLWIGVLTSLIWTGVGVYTLLASPSNLWRAVGAGEIVIGIARAALWWRDYKRFLDA